MTTVESRRVECTECHMKYTLDDSDIHDTECGCRKYEDVNQQSDYSLGAFKKSEGDSSMTINPILSEIRKLRPISYYDGVLYIITGIPVERVIITGKDDNAKTTTDHVLVSYVVSSDKKLRYIEEMEDFEMPKFTAQLDVRWQYSDIVDWIQTDERTDIAKVYHDIDDKLRKLIDFANDDYYTIITLWIIGTYISKIFSYFPYLDFFGTKGSAKSKIMTLLEKMVFNGKLVSAITTAVLYRIVEATGCTLLIDETEYLKSPKYERTEMLLTMLKTSYKTNAKVPVNVRSVQTQDWSPYLFDAGTCIALGHISGLDEVLEDRAIQVRMEITRNNEIGNTDPELDITEADWSQLRNGIYRLILENVDDIVALAKKGLTHEKIGNRELNQIWKPLLVLADFFESNGVPDLKRKINAVIDITHAAKVESNREDNPDTQVLDFLMKYIIDDNDITHVKGEPDYYLQQDIFDKININYDPEWLKNSKSLGTIFKRIGIKGKRHSNGKMVCITPQILKSIADRFTIEYDSLKDVKASW